MAISAQDVKKLRDLTNAGMMDCKKALTEANGDFEAARDILRKRGQVIAAKREDRQASEGAALSKVAPDAKSGVAIILNCETDFVAKNADFLALAGKILDLALAQMPADLDALKALALDGATVADKVTELSGVIGEKIDLSAYNTVKADHVGSYIHMNNKIATLVGFNQAGVDAQVAKDVAMQVAAMSPVAVDRASVPQSVVEHELSVAVEKTKEELVKKAVENAITKAGFNLYISESEEHLNEGIMKGNITEAEAQQIRDLKAKTAEEAAANLKEQMIQNIAQGRLNKFYKESTLMEQESVKDSKQTIAQFLNAASKGLKATSFVRLSLN